MVKDNLDIFNDNKIIDSWKKNVSPWLKAIQGKEIESRILVTDQAIVETLLSIPAKNILDIGCGEGWLVRELSALGITTTGIDAIEGLVAQAKELGGGSFKTLEYQHISASTIVEKFDIAVCNFSLIGKESVEYIFNTIPSLLNDESYLIIQTLHPLISCGDQSYSDGWRDGSWDGFSPDFSDPAPWYFRTLESWAKLFSSNGFILDGIKEPINPKTGKPASLIMVGRLAV